MNNAALAAGATVIFPLLNSLITNKDLALVTIGGNGGNGAYTASCRYCVDGQAGIEVKNISAGSLSEAVVINFAIIKGATT